MDAFGKSALLAPAIALLFASPAAARSWRDIRKTVLNARHRVAMAFHANIFELEEAPKADDEGEIYVSKDACRTGDCTE